MGPQAVNCVQHDNIVKYIGFVKSVDCLNIILEYAFPYFPRVTMRDVT